MTCLEDISHRAGDHFRVSVNKNIKTQQPSGQLAFPLGRCWSFTVVGDLVGALVSFDRGPQLMQKLLSLE